MAKPKDIPLLVCTAHKGVFFGYGQPTTDKIIRITDARMCVYWSPDTHGINGLASDGPGKTSRITPAVPAITLQDVTAIMECSEKAAEAWSKFTWK